MKKIGFLLVCLGLLVGYAFFFVVQPEQVSHETSQARFFRTDGISSIQIFDENGTKAHIERKNDIWMSTKPFQFPCSPEFMERSLQAMFLYKPETQFPLQEDRYGFSSSSREIRFGYENGEVKTYKIGDVEGPQQGLYILQVESNEVYVLHRLWGQFFYYPREQFLFPGLFIPGRQIFQVRWYKGKKLTWSLESGGIKTLSVQFEGKSFSSKKSKWLWFFQRIRKTKVANWSPLFSDEWKEWGRLEIQSDKGLSSYFIDPQGKIIVDSTYKVQGQLEQDLISSLVFEMRKVLKGDKK